MIVQVLRVLCPEIPISTRVWAGVPLTRCLLFYKEHSELIVEFIVLKY